MMVWVYEVGLGYPLFTLASILLPVPMVYFLQNLHRFTDLKHSSSVSSTTPQIWETYFALDLAF